MTATSAHPPCPACQPVRPTEWATWDALLARVALDKPGSFYPLDIPLCLPLLGQLAGWTLVLAQLCLLGPYSKTVVLFPDAQDPGAEEPAQNLKSGVLVAKQAKRSPGCGWDPYGLALGPAANSGTLGPLEGHLIAGKIS